MPEPPDTDPWIDDRYPTEERPADSTKRRRGRGPAVALAVLVMMALGAGALAANKTKSPAEAAAEAEAPERSAITAPVELRELVSTVIGRANVRADTTTPVDCKPAALSVDGASAPSTPVMTRQPPAAGTPVQEGQVLAGVNGRPVIALDGATPAFRQMGPGVAGDDVAQLQAALARLGFESADKAGTYGPGTEAAVRGLYQSRGYEAAEPTSEQKAALAAAEASAAQAGQARRQAADALALAGQAPPKTAVRTARLAVASAQRTFDDAKAAGGDTAAAEAQLLTAKDSLAQLTAPRDTGPQKAALDDANRMLFAATVNLGQLSSTTGTAVPYCEVVFVPGLPGIIDRPASTDGAAGESTAGGGAAEGGAGAGTQAWLQVTGGVLVAVATVSDTDRQLLAVGGPALLGGAGSETPGTVRSIDADPAQPGQWTVTITPVAAFDSAQLGANQRVAFPVGSTDGEVLVVPLAAVSARPDGSTHVTKVAGGTRTDVTVEAGLSADGYVQVATTGDAGLEAGEQVLVGR